MRQVFIFLISCYKTGLSPFMGNNCRFYPCCSSYAVEAIEAYGVFKGSSLAIRRLSRCHPWHKGGIDLVPSCNHPAHQ